MRQLRCALGLILAALALAAPATAQASSKVTNVYGEPANFLDAVSENTVITTGIGTVVCDTTRWEMNLSTNTTETAFGSGSGSAEGSENSHEGPCAVAQNGIPVTVTELTISGLHLVQFGSSVQVTYKLDFAGAFSCSYTGTIPVSYSPTTENFSISGTLASLSSFPCSTSAAIHGNYQVSEMGQTAIIH
jgi:hypothetical protein